MRNIVVDVQEQLPAYLKVIGALLESLKLSAGVSRHNTGYKHGEHALYDGFAYRVVV